MAEGDFKLLHSSDWHLEQPMAGLVDMPDELREVACEAAYNAAQQVIELALVEGVAALLLAGDIVDLSRAGPRAIVFLQEQFARLETRGVSVFWASGRCDPLDDWPNAVSLPPNVVRFPVGRIEQHDLRRDGKLLARVQGSSAVSNGSVESSGFHRDANGVYTVGIAHGTSDSAGKEGDRLHYMALGGRHRRATVDTKPGIAHYCGTPQGRSPQEAGPSGATLVNVDSGKTAVKFLSTDVIRWTHETIEFTASTTIDQLESRLNERCDKLRSQSQGMDLIVSWHLRGAGPLTHRLRPGGETDDLLARLRRRGLSKQPLVFSARTECESAAQPPEEWYDQETILGDLLRQIREFESDPSLPLDLSELLPTDLPEASLRSIAKIRDRDHRSLLVERAKKLGLDLLTSPQAANRELQPVSQL